MTAGPLPKDHNQYEPYRPHEIKFPALPCKVEIIHVKGCFFLLKDSPQQQDVDILKDNFLKVILYINYLNKLITMGSSGPV